MPCAKGTLELTNSKGERFEVEIAVTTTIKLESFLVDDKFMGGNIRAVRDFLDVSPEELPLMPPDREVEFATALLPETCWGEGKAATLRSKSSPVPLVRRRQNGQGHPSLDTTPDEGL
jgi:hypothetical protein